MSEDPLDVAGRLQSLGASISSRSRNIKRNGDLEDLDLDEIDEWIGELERLRDVAEDLGVPERRNG